ncbi:translocation/assembly module TamB domain-containing protein [Pontibacter silvestris]|uniref:Translocation/assembly module TamB domain-containing protein n=1 Tax=Pontibacter silvestris TaxID=2305183 RepID=A0ABW4X2W4_9BACT|nr:translocation/assembly module TamB [Pontibacter silvestris]MCC9135053.1 translocation/assembly module TamB domain-containing protein [Pontibacter silvestris]
MWLLLAIVGLVILIVIALQFQPVQNFLAQKGASYLSNTLNTRVEIGGFTTNWRNTLVLKNVYVEDQQQDTLWYSEYLGADLRIWSLISGEVNVGEVNLEHATANIHIRPDSSTNYDFITEAFASDTAAAQPADTASSSMAISVGEVNLEDIYVNFRDEAGGNLVRGRVGQLTTTMDEIDLDAQRYIVDEIELSNTGLNYVQAKLPPPDTTESEPLEMEFGISRVALNNIDLSYVSQPAEQRIELKLGQSELTADNIDIPNAKVNLNTFELHNTSVVYAQESSKPIDSLAVNPARTEEELDESVETSQGQPMDWVIGLNNMNVSGLQIIFDNFNMPAQSQGMDFNHIRFDSVEVKAGDILYSQNRMGLNIDQFRMVEKSGFRLENLQAAITVDSTSARIADLDLRTGNSRLTNELAATYPSLDAVADNPEQVAVDLNIADSYIGMQDLKYFAPDLVSDPSFRAVANSTIRLEGQAEGQLDNITIPRFQAAGLKGTVVDISGNVRNAMNPDQLFMNLDINRFATTRTDIQALLPPGTLPPDIRIPGNISMTGNFRGGMTEFDAQADLRSSAGNIYAVVDMDQDTEAFKATIRTGRFDLSQVTAPELGLGVMALEVNANGRGLTPETMRAEAQAHIQEFNYNNYTYNDIDVNANINQNLYTVTATAEDENLAFDLNGDFNMRNSEQPAYAFNLDLEGANLQALNLYSEELRLQGQVAGNFTGADASSISGTLEMNEFIVQHSGQTIPVDSLVLAVDQSGPGAEVTLNSNLLAADMRFANSFDTLPTALQKYFSNYLDLQPDPPYPTDVNLGDFVFEMELLRPSVVTSFVPGLENFQPAGPITGNYNSSSQQLAVHANFSNITYTDYALQDLAFQIRGNREELGYSLELDRLVSPSFRANNISLSGAAGEDALTVRLAMAGDSSASQEQFVLGGTLNSIGNGFRFSFNPDQLVINGDQWTVPQDNYLQFGGNVLYANNIRLQRNNSFLLLNSTGELSPTAPLQVQFGDFDIGYLLETFQPSQDSVNLVDGTINGEATLENLMAGTLSFTSDLTITELAYMGTPVGTIGLEANSSGNNRYNIDASLSGNGNQVLINGFYEAQPNANLLNLDANINSLALASLQGFTQGMVEDMDGSANGRLRITGTLDDPNIIGDLNFNQAQFNVSMLNSIYRLEDERLAFTEQGINFPNFTLTDTLGNDLVVSGNVLTQDYTDYSFDLNITTDQFLAMNSTSQDNDLFYGTVLLAADASITGNMTQPVVEVDVSVLEGSEFTAVVPADEAGAAEREGIVEFVNLNESLSAITGGQEEEDSTQTTGFVGADIEAQVRVTDETPITIIIDPTTGDNLVVRGTADPLYVGITPSGQINMTGRYEITDGRYSMDFYDLASRELDIAEGSYIAWTGDPLQADLNITAIYRVETAPTELVASQIGGDTQDPSLRNDVPFEVLVEVGGEILSLDIDFDIQLPEEQRGNVGEQVTASLASLRQDDSQLNKQVFALLVLGRFLAPDPLQSAGGGGIASAARNSLSQVMTDQLNQLTNKYAGGLGLELGVNSYEDYSSGSAEGRTDLNVALNQQFLNDRLTVRVGSDIGLEGQSESTNSMSGFGGDISVEYSLTEDGRLRLRGFQRNQYEGFLQGDVRATGLSLIFVRDYNNFSDLFRSLEGRKEREAERRKEKATSNNSSK